MEILFFNSDLNHRKIISPPWTVMGDGNRGEAELELLFLLQHQSIRSTDKLEKLILFGYLSGHLPELEYLSAIRLYYNMKSLYLSTMDPVFHRCLFDLYDQVTTRIQERMSEVEALQNPQLS